jgi:glycine cleavage system H lipoate-binding protein/ABC-type phosphate transport system substrate-binding protein
MKTRILLIVSSLILVWNMGSGKDTELKQSTSAGKDQVTVICSRAVQGLAAEWIKDYNQVNGKTCVELKEAGEHLKTMNLGEIAIASKENIPDNAAWRMGLGREIIVPVINDANPYIKILTTSGVSQANLKTIFADPAHSNWGMLTGAEGSDPVHLIILSGPNTAEALYKYLEINSFGDGIIITGDNVKLQQVLLTDPLALGFCNLSGILGADGKNILAGSRLLPVDKNGNGKLDYMEDIYSDAETFARGVWIGKYPKALVSEIYAVSVLPPENGWQADFLSWILTGGQKSLASFGYSNLVYSEVGSKLDILAQSGENVAIASTAFSAKNLIIFIGVVLIFIVLIIFALAGFRRKSHVPVSEHPVYQHPSFDARTVLAPRGLFYDNSHTWAYMEKDGSVKVGIDDFLQHITGPISRLELKKPGEQMKKGETFLTLIQKGKKLVLYAPVSGKILEINAFLESNGSSVNSSPYADGWVYRLEPLSWQQEIPLLKMAEKYVKWITDEFTRLKDFMSSTLQSHDLEYNALVLQDGGMLKNNLLEDLGPEIWEDFQTRFIDTN